MNAAAPAAPNLEKIKLAAASVNKAIAGMRARIGVIDAELGGLAEERQCLLAKTVSMADFKQFMLDYIDSKRGVFLNNIRAEVLRIMSPNRGWDQPNDRRPITFAEMEDMLTPGGESRVSKDFMLNGDPHIFMGAAGIKGIETASYFYFADIIKAALVENFDALNLEYGNIKPSDIAESRAAIRARLAEIDGLENDLRQERGGLDSEIRALRGMAG